MLLNLTCVNNIGLIIRLRLRVSVRTFEFQLGDGPVLNCSSRALPVLLRLELLTQVQDQQERLLQPAEHRQLVSLELQLVVMLTALTGLRLHLEISENCDLLD